MRVTIHTDGRWVEEYDVADEMVTEPDVAILEAINGREPASSEFEVVGDPVVVSRGCDTLGGVAGRFVLAQQAFKKARGEAAAMVDGLGDDPGISERELSSMFGVDRLTIRSWRGKGR